MQSLQVRHGECSVEDGSASHGTIFKKGVQLLAYANNIDIIGCTKQDATFIPI